MLRPAVARGHTGEDNASRVPAAQAERGAWHTWRVHARRVRPRTGRALDSRGGTRASDRYEARIDDPVAAVEEFVNGVADAWVRHTTQEVVRVRGVAWFDGGRSGGHDVTEWCLVLVDDKAEVFDCTVSQLTTASFCRFVTVKAKCNAAGLTQVVGPVLRAMVDLGLYGAVHSPHDWAAHHSGCGRGGGRHGCTHSAGWQGGGHEGAVPVV